MPRIQYMSEHMNFSLGESVGGLLERDSSA